MNESGKTNVRFVLNERSFKVKHARVFSGMNLEEGILLNEWIQKRRIM